MAKKAFWLWADIAIFMFFVIIADFMLFDDLMAYWREYYHMKEIFILIFVVTILISIWAIGYFFQRHGIEKVDSFWKYLKLYFSILWRALIIVFPIIGITAYLFHGSIGSRIFTVFIEILAGYPAIYWYLKSKN